jgi:hypothetical protein
MENVQTARTDDDTWMKYFATLYTTKLEEIFDYEEICTLIVNVAMKSGRYHYEAMSRGRFLINEMVKY